jgi:hypothetical protein
MANAEIGDRDSANQSVMMSDAAGTDSNPIRRDDATDDERFIIHEIRAGSRG